MDEPVDGAVDPAEDLPDWLHEVRAGAEAIDALDLTRFTPPEDGSARPGAVLMLFGEGEQGGELLLTERAHDMRSHPGQVSFPGGSLDPGETVEEAALREAEEEVGLDPSEVRLFGRLPELWLPPSNFAVTPVLGWWAHRSGVHIASRAEVHAIHHAPISELLDPEHRVTVRHPRGYQSPGFLIGPDKDVILWGFTGGIIARLFDYLGWSRPWDESRIQDLPDYMLAADHRVSDAARMLDIEEDL
ncbi:CoA pyrophosphatase [Nocardioides sp. REDSEA-S30_B4]|jgi:8-oxo-dGTP pyrophosphatase MutT (NUDIX family)|uniref:NUDIX hydrolase n=1 Tax=Nocardioides sp. REDSEA-S30_B4 TaxID=1811552 RepID=UPI000ACE2A46|nr:CoA pyrophosphatase [Nocardioides sp. REDSEA-S30_B4]